MVHVDTNTHPPASIPPALVGLAVVAAALIFAALLFIPAGRMDWGRGWAYVGIIVAGFLFNWWCLTRWNPELIERRMRLGKGTKTWDLVWGALFAPVMIAIYVVAGLEAQDGVLSLTRVAWPVGLALFLAGWALLTWSMVVNPFFEKTVRIQTDRGHRVIDTGPYAYVRHPGYVGFAAFMLGTPLLLGSAWALVPALLSVIGIVIRTALEDRTLNAELAGYSDYASRVRFRLIPGLW